MKIQTIFAAFLLMLSPGLTADDTLRAIAAGDGVTAELSGLQVSLMKDGKATGHYAFGFARQDGAWSKPLRPDHKIRIASISKLVVAIGVMQLVEQGKIDLDGDVSALLGWPLRNPDFPQSIITARQLLAHTSSIRDGRRYWLPAGQSLQSFFTPGTDAFENGDHFAAGNGKAPGDYFNYSNLNFGILGSLIEIASGERFDRYMKTHVLEPMGLTASYSPCDIPDDMRAAAFRKRGPDGVWNPEGPWYGQVDDGTPQCFYGMPRKDMDAARSLEEDYELGSNGTLYSPQGGLRASADDLIVILQMLAGQGRHGTKQILSPASVEAMLAQVWTLNASRENGNTTGEDEPGGPTEGLMTSYGLSVHRITLSEWSIDEGPTLLLGHLGEAYGVLSHALFDPETGDGIATIITGSADNPANAPAGSSPLYRVEENILRWWLDNRD